MTDGTPSTRVKHTILVNTQDAQDALFPELFGKIEFDDDPPRWLRRPFWHDSISKRRNPDNHDNQQWLTVACRRVLYYYAHAHRKMSMPNNLSLDLWGA